MSDKFLDKYRIPSSRAVWWNYRNNAAYFVTICTAGRECYFGEIADGKMQQSEIGGITRTNWLEISHHFPFVKLDAFVIMPNHAHGILVIDHLKNNPNIGAGRDAIYRVSKTELNNEFNICSENQSDAIHRVSTENLHSGGITGENNPMLSDNLSFVIRWFKGKTTFQCRNINAGFAWQTRFHDHIIRDEQEFYKIRGYILNNPQHWEEDQYNQPK